MHVTDDFDPSEGSVGRDGWGVVSGRWDVASPRTGGDATVSVTVPHEHFGVLTPAGVLGVPAAARPGDVVRWTFSGGVMVDEQILPRED